MRVDEKKKKIMRRREGNIKVPKENRRWEIGEGSRERRLEK
jgi:hypothetical protein